MKSKKKLFIAIFVLALSAFTLYAANGSYYCNNCGTEKNDNTKFVCDKCGRTICMGCFGKEKSQYDKPTCDKCPACKNGHYLRFVRNGGDWHRG